MNETQEQRSSARPRRKHPLVRENLRFAHRLMAGTLPVRLAESLKALSQDFDFSLRRGELQILNNSWYVTHTGLLRLARRKRCRGIHVEAVDSLCDSAANRFVLKATVYPSKDSAGFVGYGDADLRMFLCWSAAPRCGSPRLERSIVPYARPMASGSARLKRSDRIPARWLRFPIRTNIRPAAPTETATATVPEQGARPALPDHPPTQARSRAGESLRRRFLRY